MKVLILTEGGRNIGFGHVTRCIALYEAFEEKGIKPEFIVNGDKTIKWLLRGIKYKIFDWIKEKKKIFNFIKDVDIVVIDSYLAEKSIYDRISEITNGKIVVIDDYNRLEYPKGIVISPSIYGDKLNYSEKNGVGYLLGKDYIILRKEFWTIPKIVINKELKNVLITFGGVNYTDLAGRTVHYLKNKFNFASYIVNVRKNKFAAKDMLNLMLKADICISGGGQTIYELARVGVPTIGICFAENQIFNLEGLYEKGFIEYIGWHNSRDIMNKLLDSTNKLMPYKERAKRNRVARSHIDGKGALKIVNRIIKKINI